MQGMYVHTTVIGVVLVIINHLHYSGRWLVSGSWDATVKLWPVRLSDATVHLPPVIELYDHEAPISCVAIDDDATLVAAGAEDGTVVIWNINPSRKMGSVQATKLVTNAKR
jgi:WD40 repeat protein